jgi:hypothetical protein
MSGRRRLAIVVALLGVACASDGHAPPSALVSAWRDFQSLPEQRALAIAGDPRRGAVWVTGASGGHATRAAAEEEALTRCRMQRALRRLQAECVLYAVNEEVVWRGR